VVDEDAKAGSGLAAGPMRSTEPDAAASRERIGWTLPRPLRPLADFLLASLCHACREPLAEFFSGGVCAACWRALPGPPPARCGRCDEPLPAAAVPRCGRCLLDPPAFESLRAAAPYRGIARRVLLALKFRGADELAPHLAARILARLGPPPDVDLVVAVPSFRRLRFFGPRRAADLIAGVLARQLRLPISRRVLVKIRRTRRQSGLPLARRVENVRGAFRAHTRVPARVLLVDDVATSGATARACAAALKKGGAREVHVWCFARAARDGEPPANRE
jgi:predicted amidophosphoribosyltransferase